MSDLATSILSAATEVSECMDLGQCERLEVRAGFPQGWHGPLITIAGDDVTVMLALLGSADTRMYISRGMMGMEPDEELEEADVPECMSEFANQFAGCVQRAAGSVLKGALIGLPVVLRGTVRVPRGQLAATHELQLGDATLSVVLIAPSSMVDVAA